MSAPGNNPGAAVVAPLGPILSAAEAALFRAADPLGFILFARNCDTPEQVKTLVAGLRAAVGRAAPVLIDQEGGRVARLRPPQWRQTAAPGAIAALAEQDRDAAGEAIYLHARLIAADLFDLGIDVDCAPVLDIPQPGSNRDVLGDRTLGSDVGIVATLGGFFCEGLMDGGVFPVLKHAPGHGRATVDSHRDLPVVDADADTLRAVDFKPFAQLGGAPFLMTAHVVYNALDPDHPATQSHHILTDILRTELALDGFLLSDDLGMSALHGGFAERTRAALDAGCDAVVHCSGDFSELSAVLEAAAPLRAAARQRLDRAYAMRRVPQAFDIDAGTKRLNHLMERLAP